MLILLFRTIALAFALWFSCVYLVKVINALVLPGSVKRGYSLYLKAAIILWAIVYFLTYM